MTGLDMENRAFQQRLVRAVSEQRLVEFTAHHGRPIAVNPAAVSHVEGRSLRDNEGVKVAQGVEVYMGNRSIIVVGELVDVLRRLRSGPDKLEDDGGK